MQPLSHMKQKGKLLSMVNLFKARLKELAKDKPNFGICFFWLVRLLFEKHDPINSAPSSRVQHNLHLALLILTDRI